MRILVAHNRYQQMGGEDVVFETESRSLEAAGHSVERFILDNSSIQTLYDKVRATTSVAHNRAYTRQLNNVIKEFQPDIVHVHNFFPLLTPGALAEAARAGIPTVQTLHNYRALCANSMFFRDGQVCESCLKGSKLAGSLHRCYRGSAVGSLAISLMGESLRRISHQYPNLITFIALTNFAKSRYVAGGFDKNQIVVKANALSDPGEGHEKRDRRILFVGRLSPEKGVDLLLRVAPRIDGEIVVIGGGPEQEALSRQRPDNVKMLGPIPRDQIFEHMRRAAAIAVPSRWYEACPMTVLEAFATGTPVIASRLGSLAELVSDGTTGLLAAPDHEAEWERAINAILEHPENARAMGRNARATYIEHYTESRNVSRLNEIYRSAIDKSKSAVISNPAHYAEHMDAALAEPNSDRP